MKVLMVNTENQRGGAARVARTLHYVLNATPEFPAYFAYGRGPKTKNKEAGKFAWQLEVYLHALMTRATGLQGYGSWLSTKRLTQLIDNWKPDIVHLHNLHGYYLNLSIARLLGELGIPVVWTLHDGWPITGRCAYLFKCDRWKTGCGHCPDLSCYPKSYLDTSGFMWRRKRAAFTQGWNPIIVCPSRWLADRVGESYLRKFRGEVIPSGIDIHLFGPRDRSEVREELGLPEDKKVVLFAAADLTDEGKGVRYFFKALEYVKANDWMVLTLGKRVNLTGKLSERIDVRQLGYIADQDLVADVYNAADAFCISSLDDNFPTTVLESLACGTPVVGFRVGGIPEQVTNGCGILVPPRDTRALGLAITRLLQDDALREKMSDNCRARAVAEYSVSKFRDRYVKVYNRAIEEDRR